MRRIRHSLELSVSSFPGFSVFFFPPPSPKPKASSIYTSHPKMILGLIGGSGLLKSNLPFLHGLTEELVDTEHGRVFLRTGSLGGGNTLVFVQRHDARPCRTYTQPADINYPAIVLALKKKVGAFCPRHLFLCSLVYPLLDLLFLACSATATATI